MKTMLCLRIGLLFLSLTFYAHSRAQDHTENTIAQEQVQENMAENEERLATGEDEMAEDLAYFHRHPINVNTADANELEACPLLTVLHIRQLLQYRNLFGKLVSIYELQSIPHWGVDFIKRILPYTTIEEREGLYTNVKKRLSGGDNILIARSSQVPEKSRGYLIRNDSQSRYTGSPLKVFLKYKYTYKNLLQYGGVAEKDAGEPFLTGQRIRGFDFYSFHFFLRKSGIIKALALGDFTVNIGQGLILWQGMGFGKGGDLPGAKRQSPVLKPYHSAGEFNFQRGAALTLGKKGWELTAFSSWRKIDASVDADSGGRVITSINSSGYHRTRNEIQNKSGEMLRTLGVQLRLRGAKGALAFSWVNHHYSAPMEKKGEPYNLFSLNGRSFMYAGTNYDYTLKNVHVFGEYAIMNGREMAAVNGLLISVDKRTEAVFLARSAGKAYSAAYGNAFTENTYPGNESGIYTGITCRPDNSVSVSAFCDIFHFPWLKYRVNAPSYGKEYQLYLNYKPDKKTEMYVRYRFKAKSINQSDPYSAISEVIPVPVQNIRFHASKECSSAFTIRTRAEIVWYNFRQSGEEQGVLFLTDFILKRFFANWSANFRIAVFDTEGYNSRLYAYENDAPYNSAIGVLYGRGLRYYLNLNKKISVNIFGIRKTGNIHVKWLQSTYNQPIIGSGLDEISGSRKSEFKVQLNIL